VLSTDASTIDLSVTVCNSQARPKAQGKNLLFGGSVAIPCLPFSHCRLVVALFRQWELYNVGLVPICWHAV